MRQRVQHGSVFVKILNGHLIKNYNRVNIAGVRCLTAAIATLQTNEPHAFAKRVRQRIQKSIDPDRNFYHLHHLEKELLRQTKSWNQ
jgi:hypothetical protein